MRLLPNAFAGLPDVVVPGPRLFLRPARPGDWKPWAALREQSRSFLVPWEPLWPSDALTRAAFIRRLRSQAQEWRDDEAYSFLAFRAEDEALIGGIALSNVRRGVAQMATMGYWVGEPYARRGYMTEAARLAVGFAFQQLALHRVEAACLPSNEPSRRLLLRIGFQQEGLARAYLRIAGQWHDHLLFAVLREEWRG
ncbi:MAG TPA: GNAT family protein [Alphaproteobacteria bacterium]|nr:GNAT family protein [Alphaproteobacteria bacterium]